MGVRHLILHRKGYGPFQWERLEQELPAALQDGRMREVGTFGHDIVYEMPPEAHR